MYNNFYGIGRLTADPEVRFSAGGDPIANYTVATDIGYGENKDTEFVRCVSFKKLAEVVGEYGHKGQLVMISGTMKTRNYQDKDNNTRYITEIIVNNFKMFSGKNSGTDSSGDSVGGGYSTGVDVPFAPCIF